jgi:hypothetical protein
MMSSFNVLVSGRLRTARDIAQVYICESVYYAVKVIETQIKSTNAERCM